jgi:hypothetical protein
MSDKPSKIYYSKERFLEEYDYMIKQIKEFARSRGGKFTAHDFHAHRFRPGCHWYRDDSRIFLNATDRAVHVAHGMRYHGILDTRNVNGIKVWKLKGHK